MQPRGALRKLLAAALIFAAAGCGQATQIAPANRRVMRSLQTAVSSKKGEWLDATVKLIDEQRSKGEMSDEEYEAFESIVKKARNGNWDDAQRAAFALSDGQKPTEEDLQRLEERKPPEP